MTKALALFLFLLITIGGPYALRMRERAASPAMQQQKITEDDPRWDCRTMGNKVCGPDTAEKPVYYCNALTKKGTPCKHRVKKAGDRCWQHKGK